MGDDEDLRERAAFYQAMFEVNTAIKLLIDPADGSIIDANPVAATFYGYPLDDLRQMKISEINVLTPEEIRHELLRAQSRAAPAFHFRHRIASGEIRDVDVYSGPVQLRGKELLVSIIHDITERTQLEERLRKAQRLDAIGRLAAGVAHDFNNLLALASVELAERKLAPDHAARAHLADVKRTVKHGASLTHQMLELSRQGELAPGRVDLRAMIAGTAELLRNVLGHNISVVTDVAQDLPAVRIHPSQLELVFLNIALDARDAMPDGGTLTIRAHVISDGRVCIVVSDTRRGHDVELPIEPYFLSEGDVSIDRSSGTGTSVKILLPLYASVEPESAEPPSSTRRAKEILLVDDRDDVRAALADALIDAGLTVHTAGSAREALAQLVKLAGKVDVVLSDVAMPERTGVELAGDIRTRWPELPVVLMSGHRHPPAAATIAGWLAKPFTIDDVIATLDRVTR
ncbi:MAG: response regulator [Kofleriaceae bacterium]